MILTAHHPCLIIAMSSNGVLKPLLEAILGESLDLADASGFAVAKWGFERFNITKFQVVEIK